VAHRRGPDTTVRWSVAGTINGIAWANVFWAKLTYAATPAPADLDTWLTAASTAWKTNFGINVQSTVLTTQAQAVLFLADGTVLPSIVAMTAGGTATANAASPQQECAVVSWQTGVYWRGGKPRTYLPMPPAAFMQDNKSLTTTGKNSYVTQALAFRTAINALTATSITGTQLGFVSFRSGNAERVPPVFYPFISAKCHARLGTQRRRLGRWVP
jgi:hypothetical protein